nr:hypothetical protein [Tanacetum cinerariifolium]
MLKSAESVKNDVSKKKKDSSEAKHDWLSIRTRGSPKVLYNLMKNLSPTQMKDIIDIRFGSMIGMASKEIPGKIAHFVIDNFDDDSMKLILSNGVISITPELVYKVLGVPLGGEDINRMNRLGSEDVTTLEWHSQFSRKNLTQKKVYDKIQESRMGRILFKLNFLVLFSNAMGFSERVDNVGQANQLLDTLMKKQKVKILIGANTEIFEISNGGFGLLHLYSYDSNDDDIFERELDSKMDKLDQKVTLLKLIVEDLEFEFSNNLSNFGYAIEDNSIHHESQYGNVFNEMDYNFNFNDMLGNYNVRECSHGVEELDKDFINETNEENGKDSSEEEMIEEDDIGNEYRKNEMIIINKDEDEFNVFNGKKETSFDFKIFDTPKVDDKEKSAVGGFEDCLTKGLFRQVAEPDNSVISFDLLNFNERYKSANSPSRYFFKPIPTGKVVIINNSSVDDNLTTRQRYFKLPQELISVFDEYLSKNSPQRRASIFRNVEPERMKMNLTTVFSLCHTWIIILVNLKVNGNMGSARNLRSRLSNLNFSALFFQLVEERLLLPPKQTPPEVDKN